MRDRVPPESPEDIPRYLRQSEDDMEGRFRDLARRAPRTVEVTVISGGADTEVEFPHGLPKPPTRWREVCSRSRYRIWQATDDFADEDNVYFVTDAPEGTEFCVEVWRKD